MKIQDAISNVDSIRPNSYTTLVKIGLLADLDQTVKNEVMKEYAYAEISRVYDQEAYDLPAGVTINMIVKVFVDGYEVPKIDFRSYEKEGYYIDNDGKIAFYPVPAADDTEAGIRIVYQKTLDRYDSDDYDANIDLLIPEPHSSIYADWLIARIDYLDRQYDDYNNDITIFNDHYAKFASWYNRIKPTDTPRIKNVW